ncbi:hypothetical protein [Alteraurantiacibacter buctensis]|uniref:DUF8021 domain-containing protein n=1 Tax=Alteraurantiacibacter buctensis TaxID=1503981 RepID=A0A844YYQ8_9SPHN|nr:hypothetical protein [Alteraurantiacibacter buctensis]MXO72166.1 hypothetical protein [Alteraurantiacibacter buctensis]
MMRKTFAALAVLAGLSVATPAAAQGACTRDSLQAIADSWKRAIEQGTMMTMSLGEWVDYNGNGRRGSLGAFLDHPREVVHHMALLDTTTCRTFNEVVAKSGDEWEVFATQVNSGFFGTGPFINVTSKEGDWLFDGERTAYYATREDWGVIPEGQRNTREEILAAANAYLDLFSNPDTVVPWGTPCARLEGGIYTGRGLPTDTCNVGVPSGVAMVERDYVVDVERGAVAVFLKMGEKRRPDVHTFRIEDGKIRYVHTVTNCLGENNCGFRPFSEMLADNPGMQPDLP